MISFRKLDYNISSNNEDYTSIIQDVLKVIYYWNPLTSGADIYSELTNGTDVYGNEMSNVEYPLAWAGFAGSDFKIVKIFSSASKVTKGASNFLKFGGDELVVHFGKHADQIMKVTGKSAYNLKNYVGDANWIIQNGTYSSKHNGY